MDEHDGDWELWRLFEDEPSGEEILSDGSFEKTKTMENKLPDYPSLDGNDQEFELVGFKPVAFNVAEYLLDTPDEDMEFAHKLKSMGQAKNLMQAHEERRAQCTTLPVDVVVPGKGLVEAPHAGLQIHASGSNTSQPKKLQTPLSKEEEDAMLKGLSDNLNRVNPFAQLTKLDIFKHTRTWQTLDHEFVNICEVGNNPEALRLQKEIADKRVEREANKKRKMERQEGTSG